MKIILFICSFIIVTSCTTFQGDMPLSRQDMDSVYKQYGLKEKKKIFLNFKFNWLPDADRFKEADEAGRKFKTQFVNILNESGSFAIVSNQADSDEVWDIDLNLNERGVFPWKVISALTLFIVPYWEVDSSMELKFNLKTTKTNHEFYRGNLSDNYVVVNQTLLLFAMPFNFDVPEKIRETLFRNFIKMYLVKYS